MFRDIQAVLFDLDGTLIDSAPDLGAAADKMRTDRGLSSLPAAHYRPMAGAGARGMLGVAFGMKVLAFDPFAKAAPEGATLVDLAELFRQSHVVSLNCPLTEDNRHMVNRASLATMRDGAILVNTGRGGLIDEPALLDALVAADPAGDDPNLFEPGSFVVVQDLTLTATRAGFALIRGGLASGTALTHHTEAALIARPDLLTE